MRQGNVVGELSTIALVDTQDQSSILEEEMEKLRTKNQTMKDRLVGEILDLIKQRDKLQKKVSRLNGLVKIYCKVLGLPDTLAGGIETAINYMVDNFFFSNCYYY